jgi:ankyrin repeat protein
MHLASCHGRAAVVELLCQYGGNTSAVCLNGKTPLDYATENKHSDVEAILKKYTPG